MKGCPLHVLLKFIIYDEFVGRTPHNPLSLCCSANCTHSFNTLLTMSRLFCLLPDSSLGCFCNALWQRKIVWDCTRDAAWYHVKYARRCVIQMMFLFGSASAAHQLSSTFLSCTYFFFCVCSSPDHDFIFLCFPFVIVVILCTPFYCKYTAMCINEHISVSFLAQSYCMCYMLDLVMDMGVYLMMEGWITICVMCLPQWK